MVPVATAGIGAFARAALSCFTCLGGGGGAPWEDVHAGTSRESHLGPKIEAPMMTSLCSDL
eukprot:13069831-Alexandrium_andersonii.AAC.1